MFRKQLIFIILLASFYFAGYSQSNPVVETNARFTIITPELLRLEHALDAQFIDESTLFAANRGAYCNEFEKSTNNDGGTQISTSRMRVEYNKDGFPFGQTNFRILCKKGTEEKQFMTYQDNSKETNLGGSVQTLDGENGPVDLDNGILSRDGWFVINDDCKPVLKDGWLSDNGNETFTKACKPFVSHLRENPFISIGLPLVHKSIKE